MTHRCLMLKLELTDHTEVLTLKNEIILPARKLNSPPPTAPPPYRPAECSKLLFLPSIHSE